MNKVSVIITAYNSASYISDAIESVINQLYNNLEIIVIDNNSTDKTIDIVNKYIELYPELIKIYFEKNQGANYARNLGVNKSTGHYIQFLDSDDILLKNKVSEQVNVFINNPQIDIVYSDYEKYNNDFTELLSKVSFNNNDSILQKAIKQVISIQNPLYKKSVLLSVNLFDTELKSAQDWELNLRLVLNNFNFYYLNGVYSKTRKVSNSVSSNWHEVSYNQCRVVDKHKLLIKQSNYYSKQIENHIKNIFYNTMLFTSDEIKRNELFKNYSHWHNDYLFIYNKIKRTIAYIFGLKTLIRLNKIFIKR